MASKTEVFKPIKVSVDQRGIAAAKSILNKLLPALYEVSLAWRELEVGPITEKTLKELIEAPGEVKTWFIDQATQGESSLKKRALIQFAEQLFSNVVVSVDQFKKKMSLETLTVLYEIKINLSMYSFNEQGEPSIKPEIDRILEDAYSFYLEDESEYQIAKLAEEVVNGLEKLKGVMVREGYQLDADVEVFGNRGIIYEGDPNQFNVDHSVFELWRLLRARKRTEELNCIV